MDDEIQAISLNAKATGSNNKVLEYAGTFHRIRQTFHVLKAKWDAPFPAEFALTLLPNFLNSFDGYKASN